MFNELVVPALSPYETAARLPSFSGVLDELRSLRRQIFTTARNSLEAGPLQTESKREASRALSNVEAIVRLSEQIPQVLGSVAAGARRFEPSPQQIRQLTRESFPRTLSTLIVSFSIDSLDESDSLEAAMPADASFRRLRLRGTHLTPLAIEPPKLLPPPLPLLLPLFSERVPFAEVDDLVQEIDLHVSSVISG